MTRGNPRADAFLRSLFDDIASERVDSTVDYGEDRRPEWFCVQNSATSVVWYGERVDADRDDEDGDVYRILRIDPSFTRKRPRPQDMVKPSSWDPKGREELSACNCQVVEVALSFPEGAPSRHILGQVQDAYHRGGSGRDHFTVRDGGGLAKMYYRRFQR